MATVTSDVVRALTAMCISIYNDAFLQKKGTWNEIATVIPSSQGTETYAWLGEIPVMREWLDERQILALKDYGFTITNRKWEATLALKREVLEDDQTGQIKIRVMQLADAANAHYDKLLYDLINTNPTAYDAVAFYHANHNNLLTGGGSTLTAANVQAAIAAMRKQKSLVTNEPLDINPTHLLVPPDLEWTAKTILNSAFFPDSSGAGQHATNVLQGTLQPVVSPRLSTTTEWHVLDCSHPVKPWIIQQRVAPEFASRDDPSNSDTAFLRDEYLYGVRSRDNAGPGLWQYAYKSNGV